MDAAELQRRVTNLLVLDGPLAPPREPERLPPYLVRKGEHAIDEIMAAESAGRTVNLAKFGYGSTLAPTGSADEMASNALPSNDDVHTLYTMAGALFAPYDAEVLSSLFEHSNSLRPNVDCYATNIDGFGHRLEPVIDPESPKADELIADAMYLERMRDAELAGELVAAYPTDAEVAARKTEVKALMRLEHAKVESFFEHCAIDISFKELRKRSREDREVTGNAYWEVLRDGEGEIAAFVHVPAYSMRLAPIEHHLHEVKGRRRVGAFRYESARSLKRFRRFIQIVLDRIVFFKEFGDPRTISKRTGRVYANPEELTRESSHDGPATEIIHFKVYSSRSPYGVPRWIGNLLSVLGSRASEEVNYLYFDNKAVPPLALLVSGGKLAPEATQKIKDHVTNSIRGKENFHSILIVEAEAAGGARGVVESGRVRIDLVPLRDAQNTDALFQVYDQNNIDKVGQSFRVPRLLRGDTRDFNRATADAALQYAESQVFNPERETFDDMVNRTIFAALGVRFWRFVSQSPVNRDPKDLAGILKDVGPYVTGEEGRAVVSEILNKPLPKLEAAWTKQPVPFTLAGMVTDEAGVTTGPAAGPMGAPKAEGEGGAPVDHQRTITTLAGRVMALRDALSAQAGAEHHAKVAKGVADDSQVVIRLPTEEFRALFAQIDAAE